MTTSDTPEDLIRYDVLTQEALREVIRRVLEEVGVAGLPGDHHFFITFRTDFPGVRLSSRMRERYPEEMTIVIQHTFWDLKVQDTFFEIDLSFDDIMERLRIPFAALKGFFDPHVKFGIQFDPDAAAAASLMEDNRSTDPAKSDGSDHIAGESSIASVPSIAPARSVQVTQAKKSEPEKNDVDKGDTADTNDAPADKESSAEIVSLDQFRNKQ